MTDAWMDATAQAALVRAGAVTRSSSSTTRSRGSSGRIRSSTRSSTSGSSAARDDARGDLPDGPFRGVPFLMKDAVCHEAGEPYHFGMQVLKDARLARPRPTRGWSSATAPRARLARADEPARDGEHHHDRAGGVRADPQSLGPRRAPPAGPAAVPRPRWRPGWCAAAHGNDMGGSIRFPASWCGLVGLKPTRARTTLGPDFGELWGPTTHEHVLDAVGARQRRDPRRRARTRGRRSVRDRAAGPAVHRGDRCRPGPAAHRVPDRARRRHR